MEEPPAEADAKDAMQIEAPAAREKDLDANFIDDEDLQAALSRSRRQKVKRTKITPEEIAQRCKLLLFPSSCLLTQCSDPSG